jgi:hypothetical protein
MLNAGKIGAMLLDSLIMFFILMVLLKLIKLLVKIKQFALTFYALFHLNIKTPRR